MKAMMRVIIFQPRLQVTEIATRPALDQMEGRDGLHLLPLVAKFRRLARCQPCNQRARSRDFEQVLLLEVRHAKAANVSEIDETVDE